MVGKNHYTCVLHVLFSLNAKKKKKKLCILSLHISRYKLCKYIAHDNCNTLMYFEFKHPIFEVMVKLRNSLKQHLTSIIVYYIEYIDRSLLPMSLLSIETKKIIYVT